MKLCLSKENSEEMNQTVFPSQVIALHSSIVHMVQPYVAVTLNRANANKRDLLEGEVEYFCHRKMSFLKGP